MQLELLEQFTHTHTLRLPSLVNRKVGGAFRRAWTACIFGMRNTFEPLCICTYRRHSFTVCLLRARYERLRSATRFRWSEDETAI